MNRLFRNVILAASLTLALAPGVSAKELVYRMSISWTSGPLKGTKSHGHVSIDDSLAVANAEYTAPNLLGRMAFKVRHMRYGLTNVGSGFLSFDAARQIRIFIFGTNCSPGSCSVSGSPGSLYFVYDSQSQLDRFFAIHGPAIEGEQSYGSGTFRPLPARHGDDPFDSD